MNAMITGQLIFRETNVKAPGGRKLMIAYGIVAVPENCEFKGEHQYIISGIGEDVRIHAQSEIDCSEHTLGNTPNGVLTKAIWRY